MNSPRNKTITLTDEDRAFYTSPLVERSPEGSLQLVGEGQVLEDGQLHNRVIHADLLQVVELLPAACADLLVLDPPYNMDKEFAGMKFSRRSDQDYLAYLETWFPPLLR